MKATFRNLLIISAALAVTYPAASADFFKFLKRKPAAAPASLPGLSQDQMVDGLKEALGKGVQQAIANLGQQDGFFKDNTVKIPMPEKLQKVEKALRALKQDKLADDFVTTMNRAAEQAVPEAAEVLGDSIKQMTIEDAKSILTGTNNAATQYFRESSEKNLHARFLPIVKAATENAGVTGAYKKMIEKAGGGKGLGRFNLFGFGRKFKAPDLDSYVTEKTLDGLFLKVAEQEKKIRENPVARTTQLLQQVFGAVGKEVAQ